MNNKQCKPTPPPTPREKINIYEIILCMSDTGNVTSTSASPNTYMYWEVQDGTKMKV